MNYHQRYINTVDLFDELMMFRNRLIWSAPAQFMNLPLAECVHNCSGHVCDIMEKVDWYSEEDVQFRQNIIKRKTWECEQTFKAMRQRQHQLQQQIHTHV